MNFKISAATFVIGVQLLLPATSLISKSSVTLILYRVTLVKSTI